MGSSFQAPNLSSEFWKFNMSKSISTLLVVDDDIIQCRIIEAVAVQMGIGVTCVSTLQAAADAIRYQVFDGITIDLALGDRTGVELLRAISALRIKPYVIVISGCDKRIMNATVRMAQDAGIADVASLSKPIEITRLRELLGEARCSGEQTQSLTRKSPAVSSAALEEALRDNRIYAAFQPKVDLASGRLIGCEALARWNRDQLGFVPPDVFIAVAERSGQIKAVTHVMLESALDAAAAFIVHDPSFVMAVNISGSLVCDDQFPDEIERILQSAGVAPVNLMLEVTETTAMADAARAVDVLLQLRLKGIGLSIDDFGTGYSSLSALARMPFNELKIDRSFITNCIDDSDMMKIVRGSIALAHGFGMKVVAEGIEDVRTAEMLSEIGCDVGQGYVFAPALSVDALQGWRNGRNVHA